MTTDDFRWRGELSTDGGATWRLREDHHMQRRSRASNFAEALVSQGRSPEITAAEDVYAPLLGAWDVEARDRTDKGTFQVSHGEWLFARTLEGRAVQDVWIAPARGQRRADGTKFANRYGSSVRTFDPDKRSWQVTWFNPGQQPDGSWRLEAEFFGRRRS